MKKSTGKAVTAIAAAVALAVGTLFVSTPAFAWVSTGSRYCSSGYDAYTAAGGESYAATILHEQTNGSTQMAGLYTQAGQVRTWSYGWQNFSSSRVSQGPTRYTGCY
jgi:hypothetical protein